MAQSYHELDIDSVARIGLMYLDGDQFETVLLDRFDHTDYDFDRFINVKVSLTHMENINPSLRLCAILWQLHPENDRVAIPVVCGKSLPIEGWARTMVNPEIAEVFDNGQPQVKDRGENRVSYYYPVKNSDDEIVGVLELLKDMIGIDDI